MLRLSVIMTNPSSSNRLRISVLELILPDLRHRNRMKGVLENSFEPQIILKTIIYDKKRNYYFWFRLKNEKKVWISNGFGASYLFYRRWLKKKKLMVLIKLSKVQRPAGFEKAVGCGMQDLAVSSRRWTRNLRGLPLVPGDVGSKMWDWTKATLCLN